jgi:hypothetical protein
MRLTSTGLGIGTSSPAYKLTVEGTLAAKRSGVNQYIGMATGSGEGYLDTINTLSADYIGYYFRQTNNSGTVTRAVLDSSGNLGLGVTPSAWNSNYKAIQVKGASFFQGAANTEATISANNFIDGVGDKYIATAAATAYTQFNGQHIWKTAPSGTAGNAISFTQAMTLDASGRNLIGYTSASGSNKLQVTTTTTAYAEGGLSLLCGNGAGNIGTNGPRADINVLLSQNWKTILLFKVNTSDSDTAPVEVGRFDSSGNLLIGTTSPVQSGRLSVADTVNGVCIGLQASGAGNTTGTFLNCIDSSDIRFRVFTNGNVQNTNNSYGAISDIKLKENVTDATPKLEKLQQVRVVNYNLIGDEQKQIGVIAQELEQIFPGMVEEAADRDQEGNDLGTTTKSVKYSVFVPMLIKAMQEQQALIESLKARLDAANL